MIIPQLLLAALLPAMAMSYVFFDLSARTMRYGRAAFWAGTGLGFVFLFGLIFAEVVG